MFTAVATVLALVASPVYETTSPYANTTPLSAAGFTMVGDILFDGTDPYLACVDATEDAAACALSVTSGSAWPGASVNVTGGNLSLLPGLGTYTITLDDWNNCGGKTFTIATTVAGTTTSDTYTESSEWTAASDDATTVATMVTAIETHANVASTTLDTLTVQIEFNEDVRMVDLAENEATCTTLVESANGALYLGTMAADDASLQLNDAFKLAFGTGEDSAIYYDGSDTYWLLQDASAAGGLMIALADSPSAPDADIVHIQKTQVGGASVCAGSDILCIENLGTTNIRILASNNSTGGLVFGETAAATSGRLAYGRSAHAKAGLFSFHGAGDVAFLDAGIGVMTHQQATVRSTVAGDLTDDPAGELIQLPATSVTTTYGDRNGFAVGRVTAEETLTFAGGGGDATKTTSGLIPAGAREVVVAVYVVTTATTCTSADIGESGGTADLWGDNIAVAATTTVDPTDYTSNLTFNTIGATEVIVTGVGGNCVDGVFRVVAEYRLYTAPTE